MSGKKLQKIRGERGQRKEEERKVEKWQAFIHTEKKKIRNGKQRGKESKEKKIKCALKRKKAPGKKCPKGKSLGIRKMASFRTQREKMEIRNGYQREKEQKQKKIKCALKRKEALGKKCSQGKSLGKRKIASFRTQREKMEIRNGYQREKEQKQKKIKCALKRKEALGKNGSKGKSSGKRKINLSFIYPEANTWGQKR